MVWLRHRRLTTVPFHGFAGRGPGRLPRVRSGRSSRDKKVRSARDVHQALRSVLCVATQHLAYSEVFHKVFPYRPLTSVCTVYPPSLI